MERPISFENLEELAQEQRSLPGTFGGCVHNCCEADDIDLTLELVDWGRKCLDGLVYVAMGIHPTTFEEYTPEVESRILAAMDKLGSKVVAWGECGLDYYRRSDDVGVDQTLKDWMIRVFARQCEMAVSRGLPLVVHSRSAEDDTLKVLRENLPREHFVHMHSFMGSVKMMEEFLAHFPNGYVGIAGAVTYDDAGGLTGILAKLPMNRILLETDGPYMAPNPFRGEESHAGHIPFIAEAVARLIGSSTLEVLTVTHQNFLRMYRLERDQ